MARLGVNIDHVATLRQARRASFPSPAKAAREAQAAGADSITIHLREDRRHIQDADLRAVQKAVRIPINLEMALNPGILKIALKFCPEKVCIVPERRRELTTEGGLDVLANRRKLLKAIPKLQKKKIRVSLFIDPDFAQVRASFEAGADAIEIHTGTYADSRGARRKKEWARVRKAAVYARRLGLNVHAGHGLDYENIRAIKQIPEIEEFNIGFSIIAEAVFFGLGPAVRRMKSLTTGSFGTSKNAVPRDDIRNEIRSKWKPREKNSHKGDFGKIMVLAGSKGLSGAAHLAAAAALRAGAGLVTLGVPETVYSVLARREAEVMVRAFPATSQGSFSLKALRPALKFLETQDVLALGPGISQNPQTQKWAREILRQTSLAQDDRIPVILDADAINALKANLSILKYCRGKAVLTPHPGEFSRAFGVKVSANHADRRQKAGWAAKKFGVILVLKGTKTVVAGPGGKVYINSTGNPGMAKGGSGDVLTGMIAALAGQGFSLWDAARFGVYLHGLAGDLAVRETGEAGLTAGDLLTFVPRAIKKVRGL